MASPLHVTTTTTITITKTRGKHSRLKSTRVGKNCFQSECFWLVLPSHLTYDLDYKWSCLSTKVILVELIIKDDKIKRSWNCFSIQDFKLQTLNWKPVSVPFYFIVFFHKALLQFILQFPKFMFTLWVIYFRFQLSFNEFRIFRRFCKPVPSLTCWLDLFVLNLICITHSPHIIEVRHWFNFLIS